MDTVLKWAILCGLATLLLRDVTGTGYAYDSYEGFRPLRSPANQIGLLPYSHDVRPSLRRPQSQRGHLPYTKDFIPQNDPLWARFWDVYNYRGPLEEDPSNYGENNFYVEESFYPSPDKFFHQMTPQVPTRGTTREDAYNRYKEYFGRRYGTLIDD